MFRPLLKAVVGGHRSAARGKEAATDEHGKTRIRREEKGAGGRGGGPDGGATANAFGPPVVGRRPAFGGCE